MCWMSMLSDYIALLIEFIVSNITKKTIGIYQNQAGLLRPVLNKL